MAEIEAVWKQELRDEINKCRHDVDWADLETLGHSRELVKLCDILSKLIDHIHVEGESDG